MPLVLDMSGCEGELCRAEQVCSDRRWLSQGTPRGACPGLARHLWSYLHRGSTYATLSCILTYLDWGITDTQSRSVRINDFSSRLPPGGSVSGINEKSDRTSTRLCYPGNAFSFVKVLNNRFNTPHRVLNRIKSIVPLAKAVLRKHGTIRWTPSSYQRWF